MDTLRGITVFVRVAEAKSFAAAAREPLPVLSDWECEGAPPLVAIYRKTSPTPPRITAFVRYLAEAFKRCDVSSGAPSGRV